MALLADWLLRHSVVMCLLLHSLVLMTFCFHHAATSCSKNCYCTESDNNGITVRCSKLQLTEIPQDLPNDTRHIFLDYNSIKKIPVNAFAALPHLVELDLSHNDLTQLEPGAFLDWDHCNFWIFHPTNGPARVDLEPASLTGIVCHTAEPEEIGVQGLSFLLAPDIDLCVYMRRTTDVAMLVVMFGWFTMVISYLVYYVRANQEDARRHLEYLKSLPSRQGKSEESSTISTVV
ncbi:hypothetical protein WMY93_011057 [Mugilogobius chulae]|uniref:LRRNT domain-containing protein n=1 Tax=Mugilogobius chulae TaxID=88201 RepID=A0AAW0PMJ7_9GOBI